MSQIARFESWIVRDSKSLANRTARFETYLSNEKIVKPQQRFEKVLALLFESCDVKSPRTGGDSQIVANREPRFKTSKM